MADFEKAYSKTLWYEGSYSNFNDDKGGETYRGVSRKYHENWSGWSIIDGMKNQTGWIVQLDLDKELQKRVHEFYFANFWMKIKGEEIKDQDVAEELYDTAVNMGIKYATIFLQKSLNVLNRNQRNYHDIAVDGAIGPQTLDILDRHIQLEGSSTHLLFWMNVYQAARYLEISERDNTQEIFIRGWGKRIGFNGPYVVNQSDEDPPKDWLIPGDPVVKQYPVIKLKDVIKKKGFWDKFVDLLNGV